MVQIEVSKATLKGAVRDWACLYIVAIVSAKHKVVLLMPLSVAHDAGVAGDLVPVIRSLVLRVVPEAPDKSVVPSMPVLLLPRDKAVKVIVAEGELMRDVRLVLDVVGVNVYDTDQNR